MAEKMKEIVLVVAAHPDDESLGCGATIAKHSKAGDHVAIIVMADGLASRGGVNTANIQKRHGACRRACKILGTDDVYIHQFADNMMDNVALIEAVRYIERHVERVRPTIVYTHWKGDLNVDHRICHEAVNVAVRPQPGCPVKKVYYFEVPCSTAWGTGFVPTHYVDVNDTFVTKMDAVRCYDEEMRAEPHPRSYEGLAVLATYRGAQVGIECAEAFMVGRTVE